MNTAKEQNVNPVQLEQPRATETMAKDLGSWGVALTVMGVLHFVLAGFLEPLWGVVLIIIGVLALAIRERGMFLVIGGSLLVAGIWNIVTSLAEGGGGWAIFGALQLYWGVREMSKFGRYGAADLNQTEITEKG